MVIDVRWQKIIRDLWENKARTALVALAIAVGVFAFGVVGTGRLVLQHELTQAYEASDPAAAIMTISAFDDDLVNFVRGLHEVREAEGRYEFSVNLQVGPDSWNEFHLQAVPDFEDIRVASFYPESGTWPPRRREVLLERSNFEIAHFPTGDRLHIELPDGRTQDLQVVGVVHDIGQLPAQNYQEGYGYITFDTLDWLMGTRDYNHLYIRLVDTADRGEVERTVTYIRERIENEGYTVASTDIPKSHWGMNIVMTISVVMVVIGASSLVLSGFLVFNTTSAVLQQQLKQIGMLKTIGARSRQLMMVYLTTMVVYGVLAVLVSVPLGVLGARAFTNVVANRVNFDIVSFELPPVILVMQIIAALIVPVVAAIFPVLHGTHITAHAAIYEQEVGEALMKKGMIDGLIEQIKGLPRPLMLSLRNTFRRKGRLRLTVGTLIVASAVFISIFSVRVGLFSMVFNVLSLMNYDAHVDFMGYHRAELLEREAMRVEGVVDAEAWCVGSGQHIRPDESEGPNIIVFGIPPESPYTDPVILRGRWLRPGNVNEVVLTDDMMIDNPDLRIGGEITLKVGDDEETLVIVGAAAPLGSPVMSGFAYVTDEFYQRHWSGMGQADRLVVETDDHSIAYQLHVAQELSDHFKDVVGLPVASTASIGSFKDGITANFSIIVQILMIISLLLALVGGLALTGTMSLNVLERTREIGVMRAVGASNGSVWQIVIVEGMIISLISSLLGAVLAIPVGKAMNAAVGAAFINGPLEYHYSLVGAAVWGAFSIVLAVVACWMPAWRASRISVRESLAYE